MTVDRAARAELRQALISYMTGEIRTFAFDDRNDNTWSEDQSIAEISRFLWHTHDDFVDHPVSVSSDGWMTLRRIVAFLGMDLEITSKANEPSWPFANAEEWQVNGYLVDDARLPNYDSRLHGRPYQSWWNGIPTRLGVALLLTIVAVIVVTVTCL